jgi:hypothetical protein
VTLRASHPDSCQLGSHFCPLWRRIVRMMWEAQK